MRGSTKVFCQQSSRLACVIVTVVVLMLHRSVPQPPFATSTGREGVALFKTVSVLNSGTRHTVLRTYNLQSISIASFYLKLSESDCQSSDTYVQILIDMKIEPTLLRHIIPVVKNFHIHTCQLCEYYLRRETYLFRTTIHRNAKQTLSANCFLIKHRTCSHLPCNLEHCLIL